MVNSTGRICGRSTITWQTKYIETAIWGDYLVEAVRGKGLQKRTAPDG